MNEPARTAQRHLTYEQLIVERAVETARDPDGRRRFYPPFQHPAHKRHREMLTRLQDRNRPQRAAMPDAAAMVFCEERIAKVEAAQARDLQAFVEVVRERIAARDAAIRRQS